MAQGVFRRRWSQYASSTRRHNRARLGVTASGDAITISTPADGRIHQRSGTTGTITVTGTYTGSPTTIEARLVQDGTNTPLASFDWAVTVGSPAGGTYSFSFASVPQGGWYNVQVRFSNDTGVTATSGKVGVGVLYALTGQSNAYYWFRSRTTATSPDAKLRVYGNVTSDAWSTASSSTMAGAITFGNALVAALSVPVGMLDYGDDNAALWLGWLPVSSTLNRGFTDDVGALDDKLEGVIWIQGEADASDARSESEYYTNLGTLFADWRSAFGQASLPITLVTLGRYTDVAATDDEWQAIKNAQITKCADANIYRVDRSDLALVDTIHQTAAGVETMAARCAQAAKYALSLVTYYRGPALASATYNGVTVDVTLTHVGGTDFTPTTGITGFRVLDGGTPATISSAAQLTATKIRLTLSGAPSNAPVVQYLYGKNPTITGVVLDNSTLTLPLEGTDSDGIASTLLVPSATVTLVNEAGSTQTNLSSLKWAWFDEVTPNLFTSPTDSGTTETTDGSGTLTVSLPNSTKISTEIGWLIVTNSDGTVSAMHRSFSGPVAVD